MNDNFLLILDTIIHLVSYLFESLLSLFLKKNKIKTEQRLQKQQIYKKSPKNKNKTKTRTKTNNKTNPTNYYKKRDTRYKKKLGRLIYDSY